MKPLWPHQVEGIEGVRDALARGRKRLCLTSPTGMGKSRMTTELVQGWLAEGKRVSLYTNRRLLVQQLSDGLLAANMTDFGIRAAGTFPKLDAPLQVSSLQTEQARVIKSDKWDLHPADVVVIDEGHLMKSLGMQTLVFRHLEQGAKIVYVTATPIDMGDVADELVVAGTNSEGRACGALVPAMHYGPNEPDSRHVAKLPLGEDMTEGQLRKVMSVQVIIGSVLDEYRRLNPEGKPTILFAPGVKESLWFAEQFTKAGIPAAHISSTEVWVDGRTYQSSDSARQDVLRASESGSVRVLCNRFVLREGVDAPWLSHGIFATVFGSLQSYLQSGGRLLRSHPNIRSVTIQDHGGNWHRHGSLNADRTWDLSWTSRQYSGVREERLRAKLDAEPCRCPRCAMILAGRTCPCGYEVKGAQSRPVVQIDGTVLTVHGDAYRPRVTITFQSSFGALQANYAWNEVSIFNSATASIGRMLNRLVQSFGTKSGGTWSMTVTVTIS
jgi:superfamily II DNA or RNA helicase